MEGALENLTVLDLTRVVAGPYCGSILGDFGAKVIKVEVPGSGDDARDYAPHINGESAYYANLNRNKLGITLNLKHPRGKDIFMRLVMKADILIENFRPDVMDRLGLGYDVLKAHNGRLIYAAVSGFGSYGRYSKRPGYDILSQAMGGLMSLTGQPDSPPTRSGNAMGDMLGGMNLAIGVLAAVNARNITGKGQRVDVSLVDSVVASLENAFTRYHNTGLIPQRTGNAYASIAPYDSYRAADGYVIIACGNQKLFEILCRELLHKPELYEDERFLTIPLRVEHEQYLKEHIEEWTSTITVDEVVTLALSKGVPAGPIYDVGQIVSDPHIAEDREMFVEVSHPVRGTMKLNGNPVKLMDTMPALKRPAPTLGQHNEEIYIGVLNMTREEYELNIKEGVF
jgi:formyl-CoA transferase